jgi:hypothetical protein
VLDGNSEVIVMEPTRSRFGARSRPSAEAENHATAEADEGTRLVGGGLFGSSPKSRARGENVMERRTITNQAVISRRAAIGRGLAGLAGLGGLLLFPGQVLAKKADHDHDSFVILLEGLYKPVVHAPDLGLSTVHLNDGSYSRTKIYRVKGGHGDEGNRGHRSEKKAIGNFYVQFVGDLCAYDIPGGSIAMRFDGIPDFVSVSDGLGGVFLEGTAELTILEATGKFRSFVGGHNHMVDKLHALAPGDGSGGYDEYCFCFISRQ